MNILKKHFINNLDEIDQFEITLTPYFEYEKDGKYLKKSINDDIKNSFIKKFSKDKNKILNTVFFKMNFDSIKYDEKKIILLKKPHINDFKIISYMILDFKESYTKNDIIKLYLNFFKDQIQSGPDTWLNNKIMTFNDLIINLKIKNIKNKKIRPSPTESATLFKVGTIKKGNDGNKWIIKENSSKIKKWIIYK